MPSATLSAISGSASRRCHCAVALDGRIASEINTSRPCGAGVARISTSARLIPNRLNRACIAYCGWFDAGGIVNLPCASRITADDLPGVVVEIGIQSRQDHRALRKRRNGVQEFRRRRHRSGRARRDHRTVGMRGQAPGFGIDQQEFAPRRRLYFLDFLQMCGPGLSRNLQELERVLPIFVELIRHQPVQRVPADAAGDHVVHQARQVAGQRQRRGRPADHLRRQHRTFRPRRDEIGKRRAGDRARRALAGYRAAPSRRTAHRPRQTPARLRRCRRVRRCGAAARPPCRARRERFPVPCAPSAGSEGRVLPAPAFPDARGPRNRQPACPRPARQ